MSQLRKSSPGSFGDPSSALSVDFGSSAAGTAPTALHIAAPWLGGSVREEIFHGAIPVGTENGLQLYRCGKLLLGHAHDPFVDTQLADRTQALYARMLKACEGRNLFRVWNYVPRINALTEGLENYRAFCLGRSLAFEQKFGRDFQGLLPAASAVGSHGEHLDLIFVAGESQPKHFENPAQVPAYRYPIEHGPRPPSFARATVANDGAKTLIFISGTAAIRGHETVAPGALAEQIDCTLENLRLISNAAGLADDLGATNAAKRFFKIYLRHAADLEKARQRLEASLLRKTDTVIYLQADICREALNIEIEATIVIE
jgi:enamine deaminase RidA (YjgF/YER057c/UK114 family)